MTSEVVIPGSRPHTVSACSAVPELATIEAVGEPRTKLNHARGVPHEDHSVHFGPCGRTGELAGWLDIYGPGES